MKPPIPDPPRKGRKAREKRTKPAPGPYEREAVERVADADTQRKATRGRVRDT